MKVRLVCWSKQRHLAQIYAGLADLHRQRVIELTQHVVTEPPPSSDTACPPHLRHAKLWHCTVETRGLSLYFDMHDGDTVDQDALERCDVYLKRGYARGRGYDAKVRPLGLNYEVYADAFDRFELERRAKLLGKWSAAKYLLKRPIGASGLEAPPPTGGEPRVLLLCRTWPPDRSSRELNEERVRLNEQRAACITALRRAFGKRCIAGFARSEYALRHFPEAVVDDPRITERRRFLELVRSTPICVTTTGLHGSNGGKLGEYVAASRAIVCEPLRHVAPDLEAGKHYLEFRSADECVEAVERLMTSAADRRAMAEANRAYYLRRLRPDQLVLNALTEAPSPARYRREGQQSTAA